MMGEGDYPLGVVRTAAEPQPPRAEVIAQVAELGFDRFVAGVPGLANTFETLDEFLEDWVAAGQARPAPVAAAGAR